MSDVVSSPAPSGDASLEPSSTPVEQSSSPQPSEAPKHRKTFLDVDGERLDEDTIKRDYKKWRGADGKFREASEMRREHEEFLKDPEGYLSNRKLPLDKRKIAEKWLLESLEEEMLDPRDKALRDREAELKAYKEREEAEKSRAEEEKREAFKNYRKEEIAKTFSEAMALSPLSKDPATAAETLRDMAMYMRICKQQGFTPDAKELADHVQSKRFNSYGAIANTFEGEDLISFLGEAVVAKLRKADLARLRQKRQEPETVNSQDWQAPSNDAPRKFIDPREALFKK